MSTVSVSVKSGLLVTVTPGAGAQGATRIGADTSSHVRTIADTNKSVAQITFKATGATDACVVEFDAETGGLSMASGTLNDKLATLNGGTTFPRIQALRLEVEPNPNRGANITPLVNGSVTVQVETDDEVIFTMPLKFSGAGDANTFLAETKLGTSAEPVFKIVFTLADFDGCILRCTLVGGDAT